MTNQGRIALLAGIMTSVSLGIGGIAITALYRTAFDEERERLRETAQSQARLMEAVARFDKRYNSQDLPGGAFAATLSQIEDAHEQFEGFGRTGEFTLARLDGDQIVFLLGHRHFDLSTPQPVPMDADIAEPMRLALLGESGSMVGLDYRGARVLAAYEPVAELDLGIVAKIDLAEIRAPFLRAGLMSGTATLLILSIATALFLRVGNPLLHRIEENERKYHAIFEHANDLIFLVDPTTLRILDANQVAVDRLGRTREGFRESTVRDLLPPEDTALTEALTRQMQESDGVAAEQTLRAIDGTEIPVEIRAGIVEYGRERVFQIVVRDITARKEAREALQRAHDELEARVRTRTASLRDANAALESENAERRSVEQALSKEHRLLDAIGVAHSQFIGSDEPGVVFDTLLSAFLTLTQSEYGFIGEILHRPSGAPYLRTQALTNIAWSEETERLYQESIRTGFEFTNLDTLYGAVIRSGEAVIANDPATDPRSGGVPKEHPPLDAFMGLPLYLGEHMVGMVGIANRPGGYDEEWVEHLQPLLATCGQIIHAYAVDRRRRGAEQSLLASQRFLADLVNSIADPIFTLAMPERRIEHVNDAVLHLFGYERGELLGQTTRHFYRDDAAYESFGRQLQEALDRGEHQVQSETSLRRKDGSVLHAEINTTFALRDGEPKQVISVIRDVTERRRTQEEILNSRDQLRDLTTRLEQVREEERTAAARDIHDEIGQAMTILKMDLSRLTKSMAADDAEVVEQIRAIMDVVDGAIDAGRRIATRLRPGMLDELGLASAIEWQTGDFAARTGIQCRVAIGGDPKVIGSRRSTVLFRILQEALTNVARHSGANLVDVGLAQGDGHITMEIHDNGRGISEVERAARRSLGLVGMRERAATVGGTMQVMGATGQGTTVRVVLPLDEV